MVLVDMWDHPLNARPDLLSADRIHFSTSGQAVLASEVVKSLAAVLGPVGSAAGRRVDVPDRPTRDWVYAPDFTG